MSVCPTCSALFDGPVLLQQHRDLEHVKTVRYALGDTIYSVNPDAHGKYICPCLYHSTRTPYNNLEELTCHLKHAVQWSKEHPPEIPLVVTDQLVETRSLRAYQFAVNIDHRLLICMACSIAVLPQYLASHLKDSHETRIEPSISSLVSSVVAFFAIPAEFPTFGPALIPSVHGLPVLPGVKCTFCSKVYHSAPSLVKHFKSTHPGKYVPQQWISVPIQHLNGYQNQYFQVLPAPLPPPSEIDQILATVDHDMEPEDNDKAPPDIRNISPWLRISRFQQLLEGRSAPDLCALAATPSVAEYPGLRDIVYDFFDQCSALIDQTSTLVLQILKTETPSLGIGNKPFKTHDDATTLANYVIPVVGLVAMLLRGPILPLPTNIQKALNAFRSSFLNATKEDSIRKLLDLLALLWQTTWAPEEGTRIIDPTIHYLAFSSLNPSGSFDEPKAVTNTISRLKYCVRLVFLKLIHQHSSIDLGVTTYQPWFTEKLESTFNTLCTLQHWASSVAFKTKALPRVWWTDRINYQSMLYEGRALHFDEVKSFLCALEFKAREVWEHNILFSKEIYVEYDAVVDNLSNRDPGYSFVSEPLNTFFSDKNRLIRTLLDDSSLRSKIRSRNPAGIEVWNIQALRGWLVDYAQFHLLLLIKCNLTGGSPGRITEFTAMQLRNLVAYPCRNIVAFGKHIALLCTYMKTSGASLYDRLIPHSLDAFTSDLMIQDLAIARPFACLVSRICHPQNPEVHDLFFNHIFVNHTRLFTTADVTQELKRLSIPHLEVPLTVNSWRHISTAFRRMCCTRYRQLLEDENENESIDALQSGHNRQTENRIYGISQDALAGASEDVLPLFLDASTDWQIACGVVPGGLGIAYRDAQMASFKGMVDRGLISLLPPPNTTLQTLIEQRISSLETWMTVRFSRLERAVLGRSQHESHSRVSLRPTHSAMTGPPEQVETGSNPSNHEPDSRGKPADPGPLSASSTLTSDQSSDGPSAPSSDPPAPVDNASLALSALRKLLNRPDADWTCPEQRDAVVAMLDHKQDVIAIMATGSGKSMIPIIPSLVEKNKITVLVLPFRSLMMDFTHKLKRMSVPHETYDATRNLSASFNLILVSADATKTVRWQQSIAHANMRRPVARHIIDEAHVPPTASNYRECLKNMADLRSSFTTQVALMSGTIHDALVSVLRREFCLGHDTLVLRASTNRPELRYIWSKPAETIDLPDILKQLVEEQVRKPEDRGLIFVASIRLGEDLMSSLSYPFFHGTLDPARLQTLYDEWTRGKTPVMICTSAFGTGNDYSHVRLVAHAGTPYETLGYIQEVSRGGRDGKPAACVLIPTGPRPLHQDLTAEEDLVGRIHMHHALTAGNACIRFTLTSYIDGCGIYCSQSPSNEICSACAERKYSTIRKSSFETSTEQAKRQRQQRFQTTADYVSGFKRALSRFEKTCAFCLVNNGPQGLHDIFCCPSLVDNAGASGARSFIDWRKFIKYTSHHNRICFTCHIPQGESDALHATFERNKKACQHTDVIAPAVYAILLDARLRQQASEYFSHEFQGPQDALQWINDRPVSGHASNLTALFLWYDVTR